MYQYHPTSLDLYVQNKQNINTNVYPYPQNKMKLLIFTKIELKNAVFCIEITINFEPFQKIKNQNSHFVAKYVYLIVVK